MSGKAKRVMSQTFNEGCSSTKPLFEAVGVTKSFGDFMANDDVSFQIHSGEIHALLGENGAGKSTFVKIAYGLLQPDAGQLFWNGEPISIPGPQQARQRGIGMVFQNYALFPHMTVGENLAFPLKVRNMPTAEVEEKVRAVLDMVQMLAFIDRKPAQLSGGQQQRIALARALVFNPELVLMDEPLGALDKQLREHMQYEIKHIHENLGVTVVYVTHDQSEALTMSNRIAVFDDGIILSLIHI